MRKSTYFSKRTLYAILLFSMFIFAPTVFEDIANTSIISSEDTRTTDVVNNVISTSKLQTFTYDTSVPFIYENSSNVVFDGIISPGEYTESYTDDIGITAYWEHNGVNLSVAIESSGIGFIVLGLGNNHKMNGSNMVIGGEFSNGTNYCLDAIGQVSYISPVALDSQFDVFPCAASENLTNTIFEFKIPMNSGDTEDIILETNNTYNFFFAYHETLDDVFSVADNHNSMPHSVLSRKLFLRPSLVIYQTQVSIITPAEVEQGKNLSLSAVLVDENQNPITDLPVDFFRETQYGDLIIGSAITDNTGKAKLNYSNDILSGNITFGVIFREFIGKVNSLDVIYRKSEITTEIFFSHSETREQEVRDVLFIPLEDACCEGGIFYLLVLRDVVFYLALFSVWGLYSYCVLIVLKIPFSKKKSKNLEENTQVTEDN